MWYTPLFLLSQGSSSWIMLHMGSKERWGTFCSQLGAHFPSHISPLNKHKTVLFHNQSFLTVKGADSKNTDTGQCFYLKRKVSIASRTAPLMHFWVFHTCEFQQPTEIHKINLHFAVRHVAAGLQWGAFPWESVCHLSLFCEGTSSSLKRDTFLFHWTLFELHSDIPLLFLRCRFRGGYSDNRYSQPYSYNQTQYYQQYPDYYSDWGYDQNTGGFDGYDYSQYDYSNQVSWTTLRISTCVTRRFKRRKLSQPPALITHFISVTDVWGSCRRWWSWRWSL